MTMHATEISRGRQITPRPMAIELPADMHRHWMGGDPFTTNLMNALSLTFPEGERFFMQTVRALREQVTDPALEAQVKGFLAQEALHSREHRALNTWLEAHGVDVPRYEEEIKRLLARPERRGNQHLQLAVTCALEHFTAILAEEWLRSEGLLRDCDPRVKPLWIWHAMEELDHKGVAFDVYCETGGNYVTRAIVMIGTTILFMAKVAELHVRLMRADGELFNLRSWLRGIWKFWGPRGHFSSLIPAYLRYFRPSFHPWEHDDGPLIQRYESSLQAATA